MTPPTPRPIDYAPPPPVYWRKVFRRAVLLLILVAAGVAGVKLWPSVWERARLLYWQRQCMAHTAPPDQIVCIETPVYRWNPPPFVAAAPDPECLVKYAATARVSVPVGKGGPVVFLHDRRTLGGVRRLVVIRRIPPGGRMSVDAPTSFEESVVTPAGFITPPSVAIIFWEQEMVPVYYNLDGTAPIIRLYAGQADPADESHFTIRYESGNESGTLDGWLRDNPFCRGGASVEWSVR